MKLVIAPYCKRCKTVLNYLDFKHMYHNWDWKTKNGDLK